MKHFSEGDWADFVRNLVPASTKSAMQQEIDHGCKKCKAMLETWQSVFSAAQEEGSYAPPAEVVRIAKAQFAAVPSAMPNALRARLVFDSHLRPVTAGLRGPVSARQFLFEADQFLIDLRLDSQKELGRIAVVGQVLDRRKASRAAQGLLVRLLNGVLPVAHTATNQFGEFQIEFEAGKDLSLAIGADEERVIVLPLQVSKAR